jgi:hypothetical protein
MWEPKAAKTPTTLSKTQDQLGTDLSMSTNKQLNISKPKYSTTTKFTPLERKLLRAWSEGSYIPRYLLGSCVEKFGSDWSVQWPMPQSINREKQT